VAGGFAVIILFGMLLFVFRVAGSGGQTVATIIVMLVVLGGWVSGRVLQRFILYRHRAAMLFLFSGRPAAMAGPSSALQEAVRFFPGYSSWSSLNRSLRRALSLVYRGSEELPVLSSVHSGWVDRLAAGPLSQAILVQAFARGGADAGRSAREGLALFLGQGMESRRQVRQWLWFSSAGLAFLFICLALPNWFFFRSAGAPVWIGVVLAAAIAWLLHQAFVIPFVLAGMSGALLAETRGQTPDPGLCEKLVALVQDTSSPGKKTK
jgi:hypothetical protein